jgi:hypothetical protein
LRGDPACRAILRAQPQFGDIEFGILVVSLIALNAE